MTEKKNEKKSTSCHFPLAFCIINIIRPSARQKVCGAWEKEDREDRYKYIKRNEEIKK